MSPSEPTRALYVRIPLPAAAKLDAAAERMGRSKRDVIAALVADHLDDDVRIDAQPRRVIVEDTPGELRVGHHHFTPAPPPAGEVLTLEEAAALLRVDVEALRDWAEAGDVPGRRLGGQWRFSRGALLDWLGAAA
jgi:excisionase family DNA binding protein